MARSALSRGDGATPFGDDLGAVGRDDPRPGAGYRTRLALPIDPAGGVSKTAGDGEPDLTSWVRDLVEMSKQADVGLANCRNEELKPACLRARLVVVCDAITRRTY